MSAVFQSFLTEPIQQYKTYCELTSSWHHDKEKIIRRFDKFCFENYQNNQVLPQEAVDQYFLKQETETANSCRARVFPAIGLIRYMNIHGFCSIDIPEIPDNMPCTYVPHIMTDEELRNFFTVCDTLPKYSSLVEDYNRRLTVPVIFRLLYSSGLRPYEARMIEVDDINLETGVVRIREVKGKYQHHIVLHDTVIKMMAEYDQEIKHFYPDRKYFFPGNAKTPFVSQQWLSRNFKELWSVVNNSYSRPYDFRHNYAIRNINSWEGGNLSEQYSKLVYLSLSMGHRSLNSTRYYYAYSPTMAELICKRTSEGIDMILPEIDYEDFIK